MKEVVNSEEHIDDSAVSINSTEHVSSLFCTVGHSSLQKVA